jgi:hypothetical protein
LCVVNGNGFCTVNGSGLCVVEGNGLITIVIGDMSSDLLE